MSHHDTFVDIHCHLTPLVDDGAKSWRESLAMARMAVADGIHTIIATPHQLGNYAHNGGETIRRRVEELQRFLDRYQTPLQVLPGADVRIESEMIAGLQNGEVLTLGDHGVHVLLELPHELYFPLEPILNDLESIGMVGILSHPERNQGLLRERRLIEPLVNQGCLMQVTAGSLMGTFGPSSQQMAEWMVERGLAHFIATDAHGSKARRPLMAGAYERVCELTNEEVARNLCCRFPAAVAEGRRVPAGRLEIAAVEKKGWIRRKKVA